MIYYDNRSWVDLVFRYQGTVWPLVIVPVFAVFLACGLVFDAEESGEILVESPGKTIFASTMTFLLVFRANSASERYWQGRSFLTNMFGVARDLVQTLCVNVKGGTSASMWRKHGRRRLDLEDVDDIRASMARVNCIRLAVAFVVAVRLHTRICYEGYVRGEIAGAKKRKVDLDRLRLRGLLTRAEFEQVNDLVPIYNEQHVTKGTAVLPEEAFEEVWEKRRAHVYEVDTTPDMRQPIAILMMMRLEFMKHTNEPYGIKDRFAKDMFQLVGKLGGLFEKITTVITTPIPFPYVHLCKCLLLCYIITLPAALDVAKGLFTDVFMSSCVALSLLGIDALAAELGEPFGEQINSLDVQGMIAEFEDECMTCLELCGDSRALKAFMSFQVPGKEQVEWLCLRSQVDFDGRGDDGGILEGRTWGVEEVEGRVRKRTKSSQYTSYTSQGRSERCFESEASGAKRSSGAADSFGSAGFAGDASPDGSPRSPGPQAAGAGVFQPMDEMGTAETLDFDVEIPQLSADVVGLDSSSGSAEGSGSLKLGGSSGGGSAPDFRPLAQEMQASVMESAPSGRVAGSGKIRPPKTKVAPAEAAPGFKPMDSSASQSTSFKPMEAGVGSQSMTFKPMDAGVGSQSFAAFRPMESMDSTRTMHFESAEDGEEVTDFVGLDDDEESARSPKGGKGSLKSPKKDRG